MIILHHGIHTRSLCPSQEFQKLWRSVPVDSIDEEKIEEYLKKQGISSMQETGPKKVVSVPLVYHIAVPLMTSFHSPMTPYSPP